MNFNYLSDFSTIKSFEEKCDDSNIFDESNISQFQECFEKIFTQNDINNKDIDDELELGLNEKPNVEEIIFSSDENKVKTMDKYKEILSKSEKDVSNIYELSSIDEADNSGFKTKTIFMNNMEKNNESFNIIIEKNPKNETKNETKNESNNLLGKKRNLFNVEVPTYFSIFNYGNYNKYSRKLIDEVLKSHNNEKTSDIKNKKSQKKKKLLKRKENTDNIRKKIKSRFLKNLKNAINEKLRQAGSTKFFSFLPQNFICNISKQKNKEVLNLSLKEMFSKNFYINEKDKDLKKYYHNISVLEYLEQNPDIVEKSNYNIFQKMKYHQIFKEYLKSKEFEMEIANLKQEKENDKYIRKYIIKANNFLDFFLN